MFSWGMMHRFNAKSAKEYFGERIEMPGMKKKEEEREGQMEDWERKRAEMLARSHQRYPAPFLLLILFNTFSFIPLTSQLLSYLLVRKPLR